MNGPLALVITTAICCGTILLALGIGFWAASRGDKK